jgi:hypothetical protein
MPRWLKWTLIGIVVVVVLYIVGFLLFGIGGESSGPATAATHVRGAGPPVPL